MSDQDVFTNEDPSANKTADQLLEELKGQDGKPKYATTDDAIKALHESQTKYIPTLEQENAEMRKKLAEAKAIEDVLAAVQSGQPVESSTPEEVSEVAPQKEVDITQTVQEQVATLLAAQKTEAKHTSNTQRVVEAVRKAHGEESSSVLYGTLAKQGLNKEQANKLMAETPDLVLAALGLDSNQEVATKETTGLRARTSAFTGNPETKRSFSQMKNSADLIDGWRKHKPN